MELRGRTALITGAGSGIGAATAEALVAEGCRVYALGFPDFTAPLGTIPLTADVRNEAELQAALRNVEGSIDILFANAGVMRRGRLFDTTTEEFTLLWETHVLGAWLTLKCALPLLARDATVLQMSSRHAVNPPADPAAYALTKQAALDLARLVEVAEPSLTVKVVCPGPVDTAVARYDVRGAALKEKEKMMIPPAALAARIVELLRSDDKRCLTYDDAHHDHVLEDRWPTHERA